MEKRQKFSPEFKWEAVRQLRESGKPAAVVARELGVPRNRIYKWASDLDQHGISYSASSISISGSLAQTERRAALAKN